MKKFLLPILIALTSCVTYAAQGQTAFIATASGLASFKYFQDAKQCTEPTSLPEKGMKMPANRLTTFRGYFYNGGNFSCIDAVFSFTPKANHRYSLNLEVPDNAPVRCELTIKDLTTNKIQAYKMRQYSRNFIGFGRCDDSLSR